MARINYLNNKDLLKEIHKSKNKFSSYVDKEDAQYDIILPKLAKINRTSIAQAKQNRADRLTKEAWEKALLENKKVKQDDVRIDPKTIDKKDLVFRIMTFDHIPLAPGRKKNPKSIADHHSKLNFPPYQHFRIDENNNPFCVGKSHWVGGMQNGYFSKDHSVITNELANMYIKLCERYGTRSNWRNYTYNDEMRSQALLQLTQVGLQFDESKSSNPFAYYTATITNSFTRILLIEKKNQTIRDDILEMNGVNPSYTRQFDNSEN